MNEVTKILDILEVTVAADTALTVPAQIKILEMLGIVKSPQSVQAMGLVAALVPATTPATLYGLVQLLAGLMQMSSKAKASHHKSVNAILAKMATIPDANLTFGTFLPICRTLLASAGKGR